MRIFKYELAVASRIVVDMPIGAKALTVQAQHGVPCIWALVDPDRPTERRTFGIFGSGHEGTQSDMSNYVGTFQLTDGRFIGHVFEVM